MNKENSKLRVKGKLIKQWKTSTPGFPHSKVILMALSDEEAEIELDWGLLEIEGKIIRLRNADGSLATKEDIEEAIYGKGDKPKESPKKIDWERMKSVVKLLINDEMEEIYGINKELSDRLSWKIIGYFKERAEPKEERIVDKSKLSSPGRFKSVSRKKEEIGCESCQYEGGAKERCSHAIGCSNKYENWKPKKKEGK